MHLIVGTVPQKDLSLTFGEVNLHEYGIVVNGKNVLPIQGTGACLASAAITHEYLKTRERVKAILIGDIGDGQRSRKLYSFLEKEIPSLAPKVIVFHYILPIMGMMRRVVEACHKVSNIILIADAGSMYAAKAAGLARAFEVFTPDASELSFLADEKATHPAYISHHLIVSNGHIEELLEKAYLNNNASRVLMVKGKKDLIVVEGTIKETISEPNIPSLEAIGGTGDTITGMLSTFIYIGMDPWQACWIAGMANRHAGVILNPTPATKISELIRIFPKVFKENLCQWSGICAQP